MIKVTLWGGLRGYTQGRSDFEFAAATINDVFVRLIADYPGLRQELENNVAVAVNGQIYRDALFTTLESGDEVFILPKLRGG